MYTFIKIGDLKFFSEFWNQGTLVPKFTEKFVVSNFDENVHIDSSRYALSGGDVYLRQLLESAPWSKVKAWGHQGD